MTFVAWAFTLRYHWAIIRKFPFQSAAQHQRSPPPEVTDLRVRLSLSTGLAIFTNRLTMFLNRAPLSRCGEPR